MMNGNYITIGLLSILAIFKSRGSLSKNGSHLILDEDELQLFHEWIEDGNAFEKENGIWVEQLTQYRRRFTFDQLQEYFKNEYLRDDYIG